MTKQKATKARAAKTAVPKARRMSRGGGIETGRVLDVVRERGEHHELTPRLTGGDVDADWMGAESSGDEAVGGSVSTPDQDVVDELGRALGVEQESDAEVVTSGEILRERDRRRWAIERESARDTDET